LRILHITEYCHAGSIGGTERYILDLIRGLDAAGIKNTIGWLKPGHSTETLKSEGVRIISLPASPMRVDAPPPEFHEAATRLLETEKPDWLHFHTFGLTEAALASLAKERGIPYAFTYHSPAWTCRNQTLLFRNGQTPCDGEVRAWRCSSCQSQTRLGMRTPAGDVATAISLAAGWAALPLGRTSLRRRSAFFYDSMRYRRVLRSFLAECDLVVSCCDWSGPVLRLNGARENCMVHCPQGVPNAVAEVLQAKSKFNPCSSRGNEAQIKIRNPKSEIRNQFVIGYVGRVVEVKGVHVLMEGFLKVEGKEARLRIIGWDPDHADLPYARRVSQLAQVDSRIELVPKKSFADTLAEYQRLSLLAIPSVWMETGPLTLLEALAVCVPVYGSKRLGQLNLLREYGRIVDPNTPAAWQVALSGALEEFRNGKWRAHQEHIRNTMKLHTMADVAAEMAARYQVLLAN
jgi:glycosyltransferase involved in cell wall biosynthesis